MNDAKPTLGGRSLIRGETNADELRSPKEVPLAEGEVKPAELNLAVQIIEQQATDDFKPEQFHDTVRERVLEAIQQKVEGQEITAEPEPVKGTKVLDLMEALKASLAKGGDKGDRKEAAEPKPAKKRAAGGR